MDDDGVDGVVFIFSPVENPQVYQSMIDILKADRRKPVFVSFLGDIADKEVCQRFLEAGGLPCYDYPEHAVRVFSACGNMHGSKIAEPASVFKSSSITVNPDRNPSLRRHPT